MNKLNNLIIERVKRLLWHSMTYVLWFISVLVFLWAYKTDGYKQYLIIALGVFIIILMEHSVIITYKNEQFEKEKSKIKKDMEKCCEQKMQT